MSLLPVEEAIAAILKRVPTPVGETVSLDAAAGRVLLEPVKARHDQPPFNASAMDGYAVGAADIMEGHSLKVVGTSQAGASYAGRLGPHEAVRIFTGAPVPEGADAVIMQEQAQLDGDQVSFSIEPLPGRNIRALGNDFTTGQTLIEAGVRLTPMQIAVAAAANTPTLTVARRPRIALLATGDELALPGAALGPDQIIASNSFGLAPMLAPYAHTMTDHGIARDDREALRDKLSAILADAPDVLITTGGASVGDHDIVQEILVELGVTLDFWRINMRPGKPLMFGTIGKTLVFGLPGNPVSAMVTAIVFIKPALRHWLGLTPQTPWHLPLAAATPANTARRHFMRAQLQQTPNGPMALPISQTDSGHTSSMALADLLIVQPEQAPGQAAGTLVETIVVDAF
ncbi:molybdopterin molybdotransferase MoeA [Devosia sp. J2-20]|uniref:molybdopterin molybdotransferase MoeA n=1 Tax=Devosia sp. J2-20 TaxID=3026161 RepID=UPI00249C6E35|nr:gephyrin-like molybdotransferase Glp [Devosia sp. J2-20]WDQ98460.1 molybdopterin molybdotransferase MoeA [Devosia sp. J2-20]